MGKLIQFPCVDHYEEWQYEDYYEDEVNDMNQDYGIEKDNCLKGFVKRLLLFILVRL